MTVTETYEGDSREFHWLKKELNLLKRSSDILFDRAPSMMHMLNEKGMIVRVNAQWLDTLGYKRDEVVGRRSVEFLTAESRERAVEETLPLFWRVGSVRSVGYQFVASDLRRLPVLLDADALTDDDHGRFSIAAIYAGEDTSEWNGARNTLKALGEILGVQTKLQTLLSKGGQEHPGSAMQTQGGSLGPSARAPLTSQFVGELLERADDVSASLRGMLRAHEEWSGTATEQQQELLLEVRNLGGTLRELVDVVAAGVESEERRETRSGHRGVTDRQ